MTLPTSKELFMMNGGKKLYIYKDGFGDIYNATPKDEEAWTKEVVANALRQIDVEENSSVLKLSIENLEYHNHPGLESLLIEKLANTSPARQITFATSLWTLYNYRDSFELIYQNFVQHRSECLDSVFWALIQFLNHPGARRFVVSCLEADDSELNTKAKTTIVMWSYSGMPELRADNLMELLDSEKRKEDGFKPALEKLKKMLFTNPKK